MRSIYKRLVALFQRLKRQKKRSAKKQHTGRVWYERNREKLKQGKRREK
jgi:hypothetical protein